MTSVCIPYPLSHMIKDLNYLFPSSIANIGKTFNIIVSGRSISYFEVYALLTNNAKLWV
uniref:Uncharacterized protein n=1 Tax=Rhizophora mucronata TaxID=61149 RepID=A0A2P2J2W2_RHIMU